jgi:hypothetical protein
MIEVFGDCYEHPGDGYHNRRERGHLYEALIPYSGQRAPRRLKVTAFDGKGPPWCEVEEASLNDIRNSSAVPELNLKRGEALVVREAKCRRVILLSGTNRHDDVFLVAPIYSFKSYDTEEHRSRVKAYAYNTLFWLPGDEESGMLEGCVRLDRVQPVHTALLGPKPVKLTRDALDALTAWYGSYLTNRIPERIGEYRRAALEQLKAKN